MDNEQFYACLFFICVLFYFIYEAGQQTSKLKNQVASLLYEAEQQTSKLKDQVASLQSELEKVKQRLSQI